MGSWAIPYNADALHHAYRQLLKSVQTRQIVQVCSYIISRDLPDTNLFWRHKIPPEAIIASQAQLNNDRMAAHQQARESVCPEIEVPFGQAANIILKVVRHIVVVIALVTESPQKIQHPRPGVLALLAKIVFEVSRQ